MAKYTLQVTVALDQYKQLKDAGYHLCFAKKVNGVYNIVWRGGEFLQNNTYEWTEDYQVFGQIDFGDGISRTDAQPIKFGQTCVMDSIGVLQQATGPVYNSGPFYFDNQYGWVRVGVRQILGEKWADIYLTPTPITRKISLLPAITILVWWDLNLVTGQEIPPNISNCIEIAYNAGTFYRAVSYQGWPLGDWVVETGPGDIILPPRRGYGPDVGFFYEDTPLDPYSFIDIARRYISRTPKHVPSSRWFLQCDISFSTTADADRSRAYLRQKVIPNIQQHVPDQPRDFTVHLKLRFADATFMKEMMKGSNTEEKIVNAINVELNALAVVPLSRHFFRLPTPRISPGSCAILALGTDIALERRRTCRDTIDGHHYVKGNSTQLWNFIFSKDDLYYICDHGQYLSVGGVSENGVPVIYSHEHTEWLVVRDGVEIYLSTPDGRYCAELTKDPTNPKIFKVQLWERPFEKRQVWKLLFPLPVGGSE